jgi:hypothetical protein
VPYGQGNHTSFCVVGPDKEKNTLKCVNSNNIVQHRQHAKLVAQTLASENNPFVPLTIDAILHNKDKHKHTLSAGMIVCFLNFMNLYVN